MLRLPRTTRFHIFLTGFLVAVYFLVIAIQAHAEPDNRGVVKNSEGQVVLTESTGTCVRTKWPEGHDPCQAGLTETAFRKNVRHADILRDERTLYFAFNGAVLTPDAMKRLDTLANHMKSQEDPQGARVVGFADHVGTPSYNEKLSKKRAENVQNYLISKGIVNASLADTRWFGDSMPATNCVGDMPRPQLLECLQKDRRVEVEVDYAPEVFAGR